MLTIMIAARNAAQTIERAVLSCKNEGCPLLLVDDQCNDDTTMRARHAAGEQLQIVRTSSPGGVAVARQTGLNAVSTPYAAWLDADDVWLNGRAGRLLPLLQAGADVAVDTLELFDGARSTFLRKLATPDFISGDPHPLRLFERNYLPGDTQTAFRTAIFRQAGGYDPAIVGPESFDLLLRALLIGARFAYTAPTGYRMFAYPNSLSRDLERQRASTREVLRKHSYEQIEAACCKRGYPPRVVIWLLISMALFRAEPGIALDFLQTIKLVKEDSGKVLEPAGPCPLPEDWRHAFFLGTTLLLIGDPEQSVHHLQRAEGLLATAEGINNLGVAQRRLGNEEEALRCFKHATIRFFGYADAIANRDANTNMRVTTHPLRRLPSRSEYSDT